MAPRALVFGASGQIGAALLPLLVAAGWEVLAVSRQPRAGLDGVHWQQADLHGPWTGPAHIDAVFSCGPLDHFAQWFAQSRLHGTRVVAFGSTSVAVKQDSADPAERDLAQRLATAEQRLFEHAGQCASAATVLRPTLVWGAGQDRSLSRIAAMAARGGFFVLPASATGLRQPVHVQDLAQAALDVLPCSASHGRAYALGGGQVLAYNRMVALVLAALPRPARLWRVPTVVFAAAVGVAQRVGRLHGLGRGGTHAR
jgi:nucleoside-diphosphate-sugar epimerase